MALAVAVALAVTTAAVQATTLFLALGAAWPSLTAPAHAQDGSGFGVRLVEVPAERVEDPRARSYVVDHLQPGTTIERDVEVVNDEDAVAEVSVYPAAASIEGDAFVPAAGRETNELAGWTSVEPSTMTLQPRSRATVTLRITVPPDATAGERYAVLLAERAAPTEVPAGEMRLTTRVGIRIYLSVGAGQEPVTDFEIRSLAAVTRDDGIRVARAVVVNTGGRALDLTGQLSLSDGPGGLSAGPFQVTPGTTLAPGAEVSLDVPLDARFPDGTWQVDLRLASGTLVRQARAVLTFTGRVGVGEPQQVEVATGIASRALLLVAPAALALALLGLVGLRRWRWQLAGPTAVQPSGSPVAPPPQPAGGLGEDRSAARPGAWPAPVAAQAGSTPTSPPPPRA